MQWAAIAPAAHLPQVAAAAIEAAGTFVMLTVVYALLVSKRYHQWAAVAAGVLLAAGIILLAPSTGGGLNPARALTPDLLANTYPAVWIYLVGPVAGALVAGAAVFAAGIRPVTGKLGHHPAGPCHMRCLLPHQAAAVNSRSAARGWRRG